MEICIWNHSILSGSVECDGWHYTLKRRDGKYSNSHIMPREIAGILVTEKYEFSQEELMKLNGCGLLFHVTERLKEKFDGFKFS